MQRSHFRSYVQNINRVHLATLIDEVIAEARMQNFKASLIVNPITGLGYDAPAEQPQAQTP